ncbi:hypothetical protein ACU8MI_16175 [Rhizobium leguminosarum]
MHDVLISRLAPVAEQLLKLMPPTRPQRGFSGFFEFDFDEAYFERFRSAIEGIAVYSNATVDRRLYEFGGAVGQVPDRRTLNAVCASVRDLKIFPNVGTWASYVAILVAQHEFAERFSATGSHEERLTGHLLSSLFSATRTVSERVINALNFQSETALPDRILLHASQNEAALQLHYADIAMGNQEKETGADFGMIWVRTLRHKTLYRPMRFQAKKAYPSGSAKVATNKSDLWAQADNLLRSQIGHYIYYYQRGRNGTDADPIPVPMIQTAEKINENRPSQTIDTKADSFDLATFALCHLASPEQHAFEFTDIREAVELLWASDDPPGGIMAFGWNNMDLDLRVDLQMAVDNSVKKVPRYDSAVKQAINGSQGHGPSKRG